MNEQYFDEQIRQKLKHYASNVPEGMWERVMLAKDKDRKPFVWWKNDKILLGILAVLLSGALLFFYSGEAKQPTNTLATTTSSNPTNKQEPNKDKTTNNHLSAIKTPSNNNDHHDAIVHHNTANTPIEISEHTPILKIKQSTKNTDNQIVKQSKKSKKINELNYTNNLSQANTNKLEQHTATVDEPDFANQKNKVNQSAWNTQNQADMIDKKVNSQPAFSKEAFVSLNHSLLHNGIKNYLFKKEQLLPVSCPNVDGIISSKWFIEPFVGGEYVFKTVTGTGASNAYLTKKDSAEKMRGGFSVGLRVGKIFGDKFIFKTGLQYTQLNERLSQTLENERRYTTVITIRTVVDASGNITNVSDTTTLLQIGYITKTSNNRYRSIELPLMVGYQLGKPDGFRTNINVGAIVNLASWYKGSSLDTSYQMVPVNSKSSDGAYKYTVGVSLYGSISLIKPLSEKLDLFAEPYIRYSLQTQNSNSYGFSQRFSAVGLNLGIRLHLSK